MFSTAKVFLIGRAILRRKTAAHFSGLRSVLICAAALVALPLTVWAQQTGYGGGESYPFGSPASKADIDAWDKDVRPDGMGLPPGSGTYKAGAQIYGEQCASCHGMKLEGVRDPDSAARRRGCVDRWARHTQHA